MHYLFMFTSLIPCDINHLQPKGKLITALTTLVGQRQVSSRPTLMSLINLTESLQSSKELMKHEWKQILRRRTETVFSAGPRCSGSSLRIPSLHMCKQTAVTEHKQQLRPNPHKPELNRTPRKLHLV